MSENTRASFLLSVAVPGGDVTLQADRIGDYMRRWLLMTPWGTVRLHNILRSDEDRDLHDHPWDFASLILRGGYVDVVPLGQNDGRGRLRLRAHATFLKSTMLVARVFRAGQVVRHRAEDLHRLEVPTPAWTVVLTGPVRRRWGFETEHGWMYYKDWHRWVRDGRKTCGPMIGPVFGDSSDVPLGARPPREVAPEPRILRLLLRLRDRLLFGPPADPGPSRLRRAWDAWLAFPAALFAGQDAAEE